MVVVDALQHLVREHAQQQADGRAAQHLPGHEDGELERQLPAGLLQAAVRDLEQADEQDHAHAVVEERLAGDLHLQVSRSLERLQHPEHRDGIGRRDEGPEQQTVHRRQAQPERAGRQPADRRHDAGRHERAHHGQDTDARPVLAQVAEVDLQRPREQQEAEHPVQEELIEVDGGEQALGVTLDGWVHQREAYEGQGQGEPHRHHRDGDRQARVAGVDPAEYRGEDHQHRQHVEDGHGAPSSRDDSTGALAAP